MVFRCATLLVVFTLLTTSVAFGADAIMARSDPQQTSFTAEKLEPPLKLAWEYTTTKYRNNPAAPVAVGNTCFFASGDRLYAVDIDTGSLKWKYPAEQPLGGAIKGTPTVTNGRVYFGAGDGNFYCVNAETGVFQWAYQTRGAIRCPPILVDGVLYFGDDDHSLYTVDPDSGESKWTKPFVTGDDITTGLASDSNMIIVASADAKVYGLSDAGKLRWLFRLPQAPEGTSPVIADRVVVMAVGNVMYGLSVRSGQLRWSINLPSEVAATPAVSGSDIFVPCKNKSIYAYSFSGRQYSKKWSTRVADLTDTNSTKPGEKTTTTPDDFGTTPMASPTIADHILYVTGTHGMIAAYSTDDGSLKWRYMIPPSGVTMPGSASVDVAASATVADGSLLVVTDDGVLHCFTQAAADADPPEVYSAAPTNGVMMSGAPPVKISAVLYDSGSGIDFRSVAMALDGAAVEVKTDLLTSTISYQTEVAKAGKPVHALSAGVHTITLTAKDYAGNLLATSWFFVADPSIAPPKRTLGDVDTGPKTKAPVSRNRLPHARRGASDGTSTPGMPSAPSHLIPRQWNPQQGPPPPSAGP